MGGFTNLKNVFENSKEDLSKLAGHKPEWYLALRCLFEIAGNLDTIAVEMRKLSSCVHDSHFDVDSEAKC